MIATADQVQVNGLLLGPGTPYHIVQFNPYPRSARHAQADRVWAWGAWSGREDAEAIAIPLRLHIMASGDATWLAAYQDLVAACRPSSSDVELRWKIGSVEYLMFVRPRLVDPDTENIVRGTGGVGCALMALDPKIYSATTKQAILSLPSVAGGLTVPFTAPFTIDATTLTGRQQITNSGREETPLVLRIDAFGASLTDPRVSLLSGSTVKVLRCTLTLTAGQWLEIDTGARTAYLNGTSSRRGFLSGDFPLLPPGVSELAFDAGTYSSVAQLTATWRDTW